MYDDEKKNVRFVLKMKVDGPHKKKQPFVYYLPKKKLRFIRIICNVLDFEDINQLNNFQFLL